MVSTGVQWLKASLPPFGWSLSTTSAVAFLLVAASIQPPVTMLFVSAQRCDTSGRVDCKYDGLTKVPTFVNKDVKNIVLSGSSITIIEAGAFSDLPLLTSIDLSSNSIAVIEAGAFSDLPLLTTIDLSGSSITIIEAGAFSDLPMLTTLTFSRNWEESSIYNYARMDGIKELCKTAHAAKTPFSTTPVCFVSLTPPGESAFIAASALLSATVGVALLVLLWQVRRADARANTRGNRNGKVTGKLTPGDVGNVFFITFRMFDVLTDYGVVAFTSKQPGWEEVIDCYWTCTDNSLRADRVKYISLTSAIIGTLLLIPDLFVFARKLGLAQEVGGFFDWYKPNQKAAMVIMVSTLLLESIPQLVCSFIIIASYGNALDSYAPVTLPIISAIMTGTTIFSDAFFLVKLCCGHMWCCSCCWKCCHCDVSDLFDDEERSITLNAADGSERRDTGGNVVTTTNPSFVEETFGGFDDDTVLLCESGSVTGKLCSEQQGLKSKYCKKHTCQKKMCYRLKSSKANFCKLHLSVEA